MAAAYKEAFRSSGLNLDAGDSDKVAVYDIYSCFPVAVEVACEILGFEVGKIDVARITATGGLAYHGGPGSNYSTHGICALAGKLRSDYYRDKLGMVAANGGHLTEHSVGIYSTSPPPHNYVNRDHKEYAPDCGLTPEHFAFSPNGQGRVLAWSCMYQSKPNIPKYGYAIVEMVTGVDKGKRTCAISKEGDSKTINWLLEKEREGETVEVTSSGKKQKVSRFEAFIVNFKPLPTASI